MIKMFNLLKQIICIPKYMRKVKVAAIYKRKGDKLDLTNDRGIFLVSVIRTIFMRILYKRKYDIIEGNMSESNIGARKNKNVRNHSFIINSIIHDIVNRKKSTLVDIQIYDYKQMFDAMNLEETLNDQYEAGVIDDSLNLLYEANKEIDMKVKTPLGDAEEDVVENMVLQGDTWSPIMASVQVDKFGKECVEEEKYLYNFKIK